MRNVKTALSAALLLATLALSACGTSTATTMTAAGVTTTTTAQAPPLTALNNFTTADLTNAIAIATKAGTAPGQAGALIVPCLTFVQGQLATLQADAGAPSGTVGAATAFVVADLALSNVATATSPQVQGLYAQACGPLVLQITNQGMSLQAQIAGLVALIAR